MSIGKESVFGGIRQRKVSNSEIQVKLCWGGLGGNNSALAALIHIFSLQLPAIVPRPYPPNLKEKEFAASSGPYVHFSIMTIIAQLKNSQKHIH